MLSSLGAVLFFFSLSGRLSHITPLVSPRGRGERGILIRVIIRTPLLNITPALCVRAVAVRLFYDTRKIVQACKCQVC